MIHYGGGVQPGAAAINPMMWGGQVPAPRVGRDDAPNEQDLGLRALAALRLLKGALAGIAGSDGPQLWRFGASESGLSPVTRLTLTTGRPEAGDVDGRLLREGPAEEGAGNVPQPVFDVADGDPGEPPRLFDLKGGPPVPRQRSREDALQHDVAVLTRRVSARGEEDVLECPERIWTILEERGKEFRAGLAKIDPTGILNHEVLVLKFKKGLTTSPLQHVVAEHALVGMLRDPGRVVGMLGQEFPCVEGAYFAFELDGPNAANGFRFFPFYTCARHGFMSAIAQWADQGYQASVAQSSGWQEVEAAKLQFTDHVTDHGLRDAYRTEPTPAVPPTVWSLTKNMNSELTVLDSVLVGLRSNPGATEALQWATVQRVFFDRPGDLLGMAGATMPTLGEFTPPFQGPETRIVWGHEPDAIDRFAYDGETAQRLAGDPGGICFGFSGLNAKASTEALEREIRAILGMLGITLPPRLGTVHLIKMMGALLLPLLGPNHPGLNLGPRTLAHQLLEAQEKAGRVFPRQA